jgi:hypothetical protein
MYTSPSQTWTGVDVMITIFCDFSQFSAKKLAFFLNTNAMINFFQNLVLFWVKNADFFAKFFGENILKSITSVPGRAETINELQEIQLLRNQWLPTELKLDLAPRNDVGRIWKNRKKNFRELCSEANKSSPFSSTATTYEKIDCSHMIKQCKLHELNYFCSF